MNPSYIPLEIIVEEGATPTVPSHIQGSLCTRQSGFILLNQEDVATTVTSLNQKYEMYSLWRSAPLAIHLALRLNPIIWTQWVVYLNILVCGGSKIERVWNFSATFIFRKWARPFSKGGGERGKVWGERFPNYKVPVVDPLRTGDRNLPS